MAFGSRLLILAIVPLVTLIAFRSYIPDYDLYSSLSNKVLDNLPPRWETPIIVSAFTHWSHYEKVAKVALVLAELGYPITFVTGRVFEKDATKLHPLITFQPLLGGDDKMSQEDYEIYESKTPGLERELFIMKVALMGSMKPTHDTLQQVFRDFREKHGDTKPLISLFDTPVIGHHPILLGAPGIKPDSSIVINCHPLVMDSNDTFPPFAGKMPHTGPDAKVIHQQANLEWRDDYQTITLSKWYWEALENLGAQTDRLLMDSMHALPDQILSLGVPEFEFPRSDLRKNVHYFGAMRAPKQARTAQPDIPIWWKDILQAKQAGKKIVAVSQGTVETDLSNLVLPTLEALKDRDDVLVIATTVAVEPAEVPDLVVPYNARVAKFVPYDLLLPMVRYMFVIGPPKLTDQRSMCLLTMAATALLYKLSNKVFLSSLLVKVKTKQLPTRSSNGPELVSMLVEDHPVQGKFVKASRKYWTTKVIRRKQKL